MSVPSRVRGPQKPSPTRAKRLWEYPLWECHHPEEPAYGLLARVVERNLPGTFPARLFDLGAYGGHSVTKARTAEIARVCQVDRKALERTTPRVGPKYATFLGQRFRRDDFSVARRRWCPKCLSEHGSHLVWWDISIVTSCPRHAVELIESCECGKRIRWKNQGVFSQCDCGVALQDVPAAPLKPETGMADRYVVGRLTGREPVKVPFLDGLPLIDAIEVLRNVGHLSIKPDAGRRVLEQEVGFRRLLDAGYLGVESFPASFQVLLDRKLSEAAVPEGKFGARRVYGTTFYTWLTKGEPASLNGAVSAEVCRHAGRNLTLNKRTLLGMSVPRERVSMVEAAAVCGISFERMKRILIEQGMLPSGQGSRSESFERRRIEEIASTISNGLSLNDVAWELNVERHRVRLFVEAGLIAPAAEREYGVQRLYAIDSVDLLMRRLRAAVKPSTSGKPGLAADRAARSLGIALSDLLCEVLAGTVPAIGVLGDVRGVKSILVDGIGTRATRRMATAETITARDMARTYKIKEEEAIALLKAGAVKADRVGHMWMVDRAAATEFFEVHALLGPYVERLRTSGQYLALTLEASGLKAAFGPPLLRRKLYRRNDIDGYLAREGWPPKGWRAHNPLPKREG